MVFLAAMDGSIFCDFVLLPLETTFFGVSFFFFFFEAILTAILGTFLGEVFWIDFCFESVFCCCIGLLVIFWGYALPTTFCCDDFPRTLCCGFPAYLCCDGLPITFCCDNLFTIFCWLCFLITVCEVCFPKTFCWLCFPVTVCLFCFPILLCWVCFPIIFCWVCFPTVFCFPIIFCAVCFLTVFSWLCFPTVFCWVCFLTIFCSACLPTIFCCGGFPVVLFCSTSLFTIFCFFTGSANSSWSFFSSGNFWFPTDLSGRVACNTTEAVSRAFCKLCGSGFTFILTCAGGDRRHPGTGIGSFSRTTFACMNSFPGSSLSISRSSPFTSHCSDLHTGSVCTFCSTPSGDIVTSIVDVMGTLLVGGDRATLVMPAVSMTVSDFSVSSARLLMSEAESFLLLSWGTKWPSLLFISPHTSVSDKALLFLTSGESAVIVTASGLRAFTTTPFSSPKLVITSGACFSSQFWCNVALFTKAFSELTERFLSLIEPSGKGCSSACSGIWGAFGFSCSFFTISTDMDKSLSSGTSCTLAVFEDTDAASDKTFFFLMFGSALIIFSSLGFTCI